MAEYEFDVGNGRPVRLSCSIGFAHLPFVPERPALVGWEQVVGLADRALYLAKQKGRDGWVGLYSRETITEVADEDLVQLLNETPEILMSEGKLEANSSSSAHSAVAS